MGTTIQEHQDVAEKIRKLLALARNSGASEGEASNAMQFAAALMVKYNISEEDLGSDDKAARAAIEELRVTGDWDLWASFIVGAAATLNTCRGFFTPGWKHNIVAATFVGRAANREMAVEMFKYLVDQVEIEYKRALPKGLTQHDRAEFRRTFKNACARRLHSRANTIIWELQHDNATAQRLTGSTALVIAESFTEQLEDIAKWMKDQNIILKSRKSRGGGYGNGSAAGRAAGDRIQIQKQLG